MVKFANRKGKRKAHRPASANRTPSDEKNAAWIATTKKNDARVAGPAFGTFAQQASFFSV
jgi:hypothetical protein